MNDFKSGYVTLIGRPNVGKSTLLNKIMGHKVSIVSNKPQTTRNRIMAIKNYPDSQIVFLDTPGIHKPLYKMNQFMLKTALNTLIGTDIIAVMVDITQPPGKGDEFVFEHLPKGKEKKILLINKIDLVKKSKLLEVIAKYNELYKFDEIIPISAITGDNIDRLEKVLLENLIIGQKLMETDDMTDYSDNFLASEIIREKVLWHTKDELPYSTAVMIEMWEELPKHERINAVIFVDKESHKRIIIGKNGEKIKKIGTEARIELEKIYDSKIYLELWVKVKKKWRDDDRLLIEMGLSNLE